MAVVHANCLALAIVSKLALISPSLYKTVTLMIVRWCSLSSNYSSCNVLLRRIFFFQSANERESQFVNCPSSLPLWRQATRTHTHTHRPCYYCCVLCVDCSLLKGTELVRLSMKLQEATIICKTLGKPWVCQYTYTPIYYKKAFILLYSNP